MRWVYDLDGTLVDTRAASLAAYREVGVEPPDDFHVRPWQEWCSPEDHSAKNVAYPRHLAALGRRLLCCRLIAETGGEVLTNASRASYEAIVAVFPEVGQYSAEIEMTPAMKLDWLLREQDGPRGAGVYLDDSSRFVEEVRRRTRWQVLDTSGF